MRQLNVEHQYQQDANDQKITLYDDELDQLDADIREIHDFARFELFPAIRDLRDQVGTECSLLVKDSRFWLLVILVSKNWSRWSN